jgi:aspartate racemase
MLPLSATQEGLWMAQQLAPASPLYNMPEAWQIAGPVDIAALERAVNRIVDRHENLRTIFAIKNGIPTQIVQPPGKVRLTISGRGSQDLPEAEARHLLSLEATRPFNLFSGPLIRVQLLRLAKESHILFVNMHHLISDSGSFGIFLNELNELYRAELDGQPVSLPELPVQYADFAIWQREQLSGPGQEAHAQYWLGQLSGALPRLNMPDDYSRPAAQSYRGAAYFFTIPQSVIAGLKALAKQHGVTPFAILLAAYKVLLKRYTRQEDIIVGMPVSGRDRLETEGLIGFFVNTLPIRTRTSADMAFTELVKQVRERTAEAYRHQELSLDAIVKELKLARDLDSHCLIQTVFGMQSPIIETWSLPGCRTEHIELESQTSKFEISLLGTETKGGLRFRLEYNSEVFGEGAMVRFAGHYVNLLEAILADPNQKICHLNFMSEAEREQVTKLWNETRTDYERDLGIHKIFEDQAARAPEATAVVFGEQKLGYGELDRRATKLACRLNRLGVGQGQPVGLCLERSLEMIVGILAILKAGGTYVPLDLSYPPSRLAEMAKDSGTSLILTRKNNRSHEFLKGREGVCVIEDQGDSDHQHNNRRSASENPEQSAYIIFTSGSTGHPKAAAIPHRAVVRLVRNTNYIRFSPSDRILQLAPISFDASTFEIWGALLNGGCLVLAPSAPLSLEDLGKFVSANGITTLWLTAGLFHQMVDHQLPSLRNLKFLLAGGETLSVAHTMRAARGLPNCQVINGYGPTENCTFTCCYHIDGARKATASVPIGKPISNTFVYILDEHLQPVPPGVPGDLYAGGDGLASGYVNSMQLTEEKFIRNPIAPAEHGERLYKTGDLARWLPDGNVEFLGRLDEQLKIRGFRVEPGEIERCLMEHETVQKAHIIARGDASGSKHLIAYVVPSATNECSVAELRQFLSERLPHYMVPSYFISLTELPLTRNGKVDRQALPAPASAGNGSPHEEPRSEMEKRLAQMWSELLGQKINSTQANFFQLGGHSLLATQLIAKIASQLGVELPLRSVFEAPTIKGMASLLTTSRPASAHNIPRRLNAENAEELLARLNELSESELEALLANPDLKTGF